jgi:hypothetical protein
MAMIFNLAGAKPNFHRAAVSQTLAFAGLPSPRSLPTQAPVTCAALPHWRQGAPRLRMTGEGADIRMAKGDADFEGADKNLLSDEGFRDYTRKAPQRLRQHLKESRMDEEGRVKTKKLVIELEQQQVYARSLVYVHIGHLSTAVGSSGHEGVFFLTLAKFSRALTLAPDCRARWLRIFHMTWTFSTGRSTATGTCCTLALASVFRTRICACAPFRLVLTNFFCV